MTVSARSQSKLFQPMTIGDGKIKLEHRVVLAPLTRNRGTPLNAESTAEKPNRVWLPNDLMAEYYAQRTTKGGLLITEGVPPSLEGNGMPGVPGLFIEEQKAGWKKIADTIHEKGGYVYMQIWHSGRANVPQMTGTPIVSSSATPWDDPEETFAYPAPHTSTFIKYRDYPPVELSVDHIEKTIDDYCRTAKWAMEECGFDGVEIHGGNGYLVEQFLASNINKRTDEYGGSPEKRCKFALDLVDALSKAIGEENLAIRLTPFGLFNQQRSAERLETWGHLSRKLKETHPRLSYVSFIEPRYEQIFSESEKQQFLDSWGLSKVDLSTFREIFGDTPFFSAGGFDDKNSWDALESGRYDGLLYGRYFISNPDLPRRLREGLPLATYDRSRFYGPFEDSSIGYTDYPEYKG
ncbi:FMN-linked oxidoreductase [Corynespora cassiicola Philippines]|uniref:FMN-linked oxidoreductase n=1 Tax=Corynespora cassiicola Philippines TaxID=1448308 RepID=A0A2T2NS20_CORCC|nr:FMN-linked oxidoreductase [Corynespora cassiicola Philippines]